MTDFSDPPNALAARWAREKIAFALFAAIYGDVSHDPTFPQRNWEDMTARQRAAWYRQADIALAAVPGLQCAGIETSMSMRSLDATTAVCDEITLERHHQIVDKGFDHDHDDRFFSGHLAIYAKQRIRGMISDWRSPQHRKALIEAAALIVAEIERIDRALLKASSQ